MDNNIFFFAPSPFGIYGKEDQFTKGIASFPIIGQVIGIARIRFASSLVEGDSALPYRAAHIIRGTLEFLMLGCILSLVDAFLCSSASTKSEPKKCLLPPDPRADRAKTPSGKALENDLKKALEKEDFNEGVLDLNFGDKAKGTLDPEKEIFP